MKKFRAIALILTLSLLLAGCNLPGRTGEPEEDLVATQVALMLTENALTADETTEPPATETPSIPEATETPTATITPTPTTTPDQSDPAQQLGSPAWTEDFSGSTSPWDFDYAQAKFETANGYLNLITKANANWHSWFVSSPKLRNAYVETTIQMENCSGFDRFGLAVRGTSDGQQFYFMSITCDGRWGFFRMSPDVTINEIIGYRDAEPLSEGTDKPHRVGIWMKGSTFKLYIDGIEVGTATDATLSSDGYTGFLIAYANAPGFTVRVDELKYWNVP